MEQYQYIFGPVLSRRLGISLGVDLIPYKTCSFDCLYCECGGTTLKTTKRSGYISYRKIIKELKDYLKSKPELDYITLGGSGEPTLNKYMFKIIKFIKKKYPEYKVAVLTNSSLFGDPKVFDALMQVDLVVPSLDAGTQEVFEKINRPCGNVLIEDIANNIAEFSSRYSGKIWLEIFFIPGLNDNDQEISLLNKFMSKINPEKIHINTLDRPGTDSSVVAESYENLEKIAEKFKDFDVEISCRQRHKKTSDTQEVDGKKQYRLRFAIISAIKRRPCTFDELEEMFDVDAKVLRDLLDEMILADEVKVVLQGDLEFYGC